jgi:hypothetical protein
MQALRASPVFVLAVLVTLGLAGLNALMVVLMQLQPGFMGMAHFTEEHHRAHDLTFGFLFVPAVVGMLAQFRRPSENVAGQVMALVPWAGLLLALVLTIVLTPNADVRGLANLAWVAPATSTLVAAVLHPTWRGFFRSFRASRVSWVLLALVIIAAVPLLAFASTNTRLQGTVPDDHADLGHYGFMAAFGFTVVGTGLLASLRPDGWRLTAWVAGLLPALLGLASLVYPDVSSSLGPAWALAAIAWSVVFVAAAELTKDAASPKLLGLGGGMAKADTRIGPDRESTTGTPRWVTVSGSIAIAAVLLVVILFLFGAGHRPGGPGQHTGGVAEQFAGEVEAVERRYGGYTVARAEQEGYVRDAFCLDAASFGRPAARGAMGFHATNEALLREPIAADRPQALMFDAEGRALGVEYEVTTDAVREPPRLFGRTFAKLPPHPGVAHEHYALHLWFVDNPSGRFADFNPRVRCPPGSTPPPRQPGQAPGHGGH